MPFSGPTASNAGQRYGAWIMLCNSRSKYNLRRVEMRMRASARSLFCGMNSVVGPNRQPEDVTCRVSGGMRSRQWVRCIKLMSDRPVRLTIFKLARVTRTDNEMLGLVRRNCAVHVVMQGKVGSQRGGAERRVRFSFAGQSICVV